GPEMAKKIGVEAEAAFNEFTKYIPPVEKWDLIPVWFFETKEAFDAWKDKTEFKSAFLKNYIGELDLAKRAKAAVAKLQPIDAALAKKLEIVSRVLEKATNMDQFSDDDLERIDDQLNYFETRALTPKSISQAFSIMKADRLVAIDQSEAIRGV